MTEFPINQAVRRYIGAVLTDLALSLSDINVTNERLTVKRELSPAEVAVVNQAIDEIVTFIAAQKPVATNTFAFLGDKQAKAWRKTISPRNRHQ